MKNNAVLFMGKVLFYCFFICLTFAFLCLQIFADGSDPYLSREFINDCFKEAYPEMTDFLPEYSANHQVFNEELSNQYKIPVYGAKHKYEERKIGNNIIGDYRYLGYDHYGRSIPNPDFSPDSTTKKSLDALQWVAPQSNNYDYKDKRMFEHNKGKFDIEMQEYEIKDKIINSLNNFAKKYAREGISDEHVKSKLLDYTNIIYPPTAYTKGVATVHHLDKGRNFYIDILLDSASQAPPPPPPPPPPSKIDPTGGDDPNLKNEKDIKLIKSNDRTIEDLKPSYTVIKGRKIAVDSASIGGNILLSSDLFAVSTAIPTGEFLDIKANISHPYLFDYSMDKVEGIEPYNVTVIKPYTYQWKNAKGEIQSIKTEYKAIYQVERRYSYYMLNSVYYYSLNHLTISNKKLNPEGFVNLTLADGGIHIPGIVYSHYKDFVKMPQLSEEISYDQGDRNFTISLDHSTYTNSNEIKAWDFSAIAESIVPELMVRNDKMIFDHQLLSDDQWQVSTTSAPLYPAKVEAVDLLREKHSLSDRIYNGKGTTKGELNYHLESAYHFTDKLSTIKINGNDLIIHTPVVNDSDVELSLAFDQRMDATKIDAIPLDKTIEISFNTTGQHINAKGYGNRDYSKYVKHKILKLGFPAFVGLNKKAVDEGDKTLYLYANEEFDVPLGADKLYLKIPYWVAEGEQKVETFVVAKNSQPYLAEDRANLNLANDVASYQKEIEITGRIFDFFIIDSSSKRWRAFFNQKASNFLRIGALNKNGEVRGTSLAEDANEIHLLPLKPGRNTISAYQDAALKLGYPIEFVIKSMGDFYFPEDAVLFKVEFEHLALDGKRSPVDLYYQDKKGGYVKLGSKIDQAAIEYQRAKSKYSNKERILNNALSLKELNLSYDDYQAYQKKKLGFYDLFALSAAQRDFIGKEDDLPAGVDRAKAKAGVQLWHGKYYLPATTIAVPAGSNTADIFGKNSDLIFDSGYLLVKFKIQLHRSSHPKQVRLAFITDHSNQWQVEGYDNSYDDYGTVLYYHIDQNLSDDIILN